MPIPSSHTKESLSLSFITAIAAKAGVACRVPQGVEYGTDAYLVKVKQLTNGKYRDTGYILPIQIKATTTSLIRGDKVIYDIEAEAFNKLAEWEGDSQIILVLFCLPEDPDEWLLLSENELILKRCCYWHILEKTSTSNKRTTRLEIPREQIFTPNIVESLFEKVKRYGELIP